MRSVDKLIKMLDAPDTDFWHDFECESARRLIDEVGPPVLCQLFDEIDLWPENRLEHLAYILGDVAVDVEIRLLKLLAQSKYDSVVARAQESLNSLGRRNA